MEELKFKFTNGRPVGDILSYIRSHIKKDPDEEYKIFINVDSQAFRGKIQYATSVIIYKVGKGGHVLLSRKTTPVSNNANEGSKGFIFNKLWEEVEMAVRTAKYLEPLMTEDDLEMTVHLDLNSDPKYKSNIVHSSAVGYLSGLGFNVATKPDAIVVSDYYCKY